MRQITTGFVFRGYWPTRRHHRHSDDTDYHRHYNSKIIVLPSRHHRHSDETDRRRRQNSEQLTVKQTPQACWWDWLPPQGIRILTRVSFTTDTTGARILRRLRSPADTTGIQRTLITTGIRSLRRLRPSTGPKVFSWDKLPPQGIWILRRLSSPADITHVQTRLNTRASEFRGDRPKPQIPLASEETDRQCVADE